MIIKKVSDTLVEYRFDSDEELNLFVDEKKKQGYLKIIDDDYCTRYHHENGSFIADIKKYKDGGSHMLIRHIMKPKISLTGNNNGN